MRVDACEDTRLREEASEATMELRMGCLERRRRETATALEVLTESGDAAVDHAVQLVSDLPPIARCADLARLEAEAANEPPPALAPRVAAIRERLIRLRALHTAGVYDEAAEGAAEALADAREAGFEPLVAEALLVRGSTLAASGEFSRARDALIEAAWRADGAGAPEVEADAWIGVVSVIGSKLRERERGLRWAPFARAAIAQAGDDPRQLGRLAYYVGLLEGARGRHAEALASLRRARDLQTPAYGETERWRLVPTYAAEASTLSRLGQGDEAIAAYRRALALMRESLGPEHPSNGALLNNLSNALRRAQRLDEAREALEEALALKRRVYGDAHPSLAITLINLSLLDARRGHYEAALAWAREARALREALLGVAHPAHTNTVVLQGEIEMHRGDLETATRLHREAVAQYRAQGEGYPAARTQSGLGLVLYRGGRLDEAEAELREALDYYVGEGVEALPAAFPRTHLAAVLLARGRAGEAIPLAEAALEAREATPDAADPEDAGLTRYVLGRALYETEQDPARGYALVERAVEDLRRAGALGAWLLPSAEAWLEDHPRPQVRG